MQLPGGVPRPAQPRLVACLLACVHSPHSLLLSMEGQCFSYRPPPLPACPASGGGRAGGRPGLEGGLLHPGWGGPGCCGAAALAGEGGRGRALWGRPGAAGGKGGRAGGWGWLAGCYGRASGAVKGGAGQGRAVRGHVGVRGEPAAHMPLLQCRPAGGMRGNYGDLCAA